MYENTENQKLSEMILMRSPQEFKKSKPLTPGYDPSSVEVFLETVAREAEKMEDYIEELEIKVKDYERKELHQLTYEAFPNSSYDQKYEEQPQVYLQSEEITSDLIRQREEELENKIKTQETLKRSYERMSLVLEREYQELMNEARASAKQIYEEAEEKARQLIEHTDAYCKEEEAKLLDLQTKIKQMKEEMKRFVNM